jgi:hypothetical protein
MKTGSASSAKIGIADFSLQKRTPWGVGSVPPFEKRKRASTLGENFHKTDESRLYCLQFAQGAPFSARPADHYLK